MADGDDHKTPEWEYKDNTPDKHHLEVRLHVKGLKTKVDFHGMKIHHKELNAKIECQFTNKSFAVQIDLTTKEKAEEKIIIYKFIVENLPEDLDPDNCYYKVREDLVRVVLAKASQSSWECHFHDMAPSLSY